MKIIIHLGKMFFLSAILFILGQNDNPTIRALLQQISITDEDGNEFLYGDDSVDSLKSHILSNYNTIDALEIVSKKFEDPLLRSIISSLAKECIMLDYSNSSLREKIHIRKQNIKALSEFLKIDEKYIQKTLNLVNYNTDPITCLVRLKEFYLSGELVNCISGMKQEQDVLHQLVSGSIHLIQDIRRCESKISNYESIVGEYQRKRCGFITHTKQPRNIRQKKQALLALKQHHKQLSDVIAALHM